MRMSMFSTIATDRGNNPTMRRAAATGNTSNNNDDTAPLLADASASAGLDESTSSVPGGALLAPMKDVEMNATPATSPITNNHHKTTSPSAPYSPGGTTLKHKNSNLNLEGVAANIAKQSSEQAKALWACGLYSFCSVSMILVNKSLASRYVRSSSYVSLVVVFSSCRIQRKVCRSNSFVSAHIHICFVLFMSFIQLQSIH
jgi:hypothetical protein